MSKSCSFLSRIVEKTNDRGELHGIRKTYAMQNGVEYLDSVATWENGEIVGTMYWYKPDGSAYAIIPYENGMWNGEVTFFYETIKCTSLYKDHKEVPNTTKITPYVKGETPSLFD